MRVLSRHTLSFRVLSFAYLLLTALCAGEAFAMSMLKAEEVCVFSPIEGTLTFHGKPAAGARIIRTVAWKDEQGETDETVADENGRFSLPVMNRSLRQAFPSQFVAHQKIQVFYQDQEFLIWTTGKLDKEIYGEWGRKPTDFRCELTDDLRRVEVEIGAIGTTCQWIYEDN